MTTPMTPRPHGGHPATVPSPQVVRHLDVPAPTWTEEYDAVIIGSGAAGLSAALTAAAGGRRVLVLTKDRLLNGSTSWAQGGLAAVLDPADSARAHVEDTLVAGAGLSDETAVRTLVAEAPEAIARLEALGAQFDPDGTGGRALTREGGHSARRIVHAGGDASGAEVARTLLAALPGSGVDVLEHAIALDALRDATGQVVGVSVLRTDDAGVGVSVGQVLARAVVLATGGIGQAFPVTTNPAVATGDGLALAVRAGAVATDVEFVQFHPTVLWTPQTGAAGAAGSSATSAAGSAGSATTGSATTGSATTGSATTVAFLISEAVRGEGAVLVDATGSRVMLGAHPLADLAPRDVVASTMHARMREAPGGVDDHLWLDATRLGPAVLERRFPTIMGACRAAGIDPVTEPIPVAPAAHYFCGGVRADLDGRTSVPGLYAVGEVACTGVHGANRLASNSITEGLVAGRRVGVALTHRLPRVGGPPVAWSASSGSPGSGAPGGPGRWVDPTTRRRTAELTWRDAGVLRDPTDLVALLQHLDAVSADVHGGPVAAGGVAPHTSVRLPTRAAVEATNLHTVTVLVATAALARTESRGCHRRVDVTEPRPEWLTHIDLTLPPDDGSLWAPLQLTVERPEAVA